MTDSRMISKENGKTLYEFTLIRQEDEPKEEAALDIVKITLTNDQAKHLLEIYEQEGSNQTIIAVLKEAIKQAG